MRKITVFVIGIILGSTLLFQPAMAWDDCARGLVDDPYPGECARYIDTDNDGICDHSQPAPEDREEREEGVEEIVGDSVNESTSSNSEEVGSVEAVELTGEDSKPIKKLLPSIGMVVFYLAGILSYVAYKKNKAR